MAWQTLSRTCDGLAFPSTLALVDTTPPYARGPCSPALFTEVAAVPLVVAPF